MTHAKLSPSASDRWMVCPGSVQLIESLGPQEEKYSEAAEEGTAAHELAEYCLKNNTDPWDCLGDEFNGFIVDKEMAAGVEYYIAYIDEHIRDPEYAHVESKIPLFYQPNEEGTSDFVGIQDKILHIMDLKYGKGLRVTLDRSARKKAQLPIYGVSAWEDLQLIYDIEEVHLHIIQPRLHHTDVQKYTIEELVPIQSYIAERAELANSGTGELVPGEDQCRWCPGAALCRERANKNLETLSLEFEDLEQEEVELTSVNLLTKQEMSLILKHMNEVNKWFSTIQAYAHSVLEQGKDFPGYKLVEGKSNRKWKDEKAAEKALRAKFKKADLFTQKLVSPAQAEKLIKQLKDKASTRFQNNVQKCITKPKGKPALAVESDDRPALTYGNDFEDLDADIENDDLLG